jgi:phosphoribosyl 1,2-cyclic phosphate phosphodiesterase
MSVKFTILGCGSSFGIPRIDGSFGKCDPNNKKNYRTRCSALISAHKSNILIDTSPDIKFQLISNKIKNIDRVFYTHFHADQTHGINDLRFFYLKNKKKVPVFANKRTKNYLINTFSYCFKNSTSYPATLKMNRVKKLHSYKYGKEKILIKSIPVQHGNISSICYIINNKCAYAPDINKIYPKDLMHFKNLKYLIIDCLRYDPHPSHFNLVDVINLIKLIKPKKTIITNLNHEIDYLTIKKILPKNVIPAYDGLSLLI